MEPMSVAGGLAGLVVTTAQVSRALTDLIQVSRHAPRECSKIRDQCDDVHRILGQLQQFLLGRTQAPRQRTSLLMLDQVMATLSGCVTTFLETQKYTQGLTAEAEMGLLDRVRWAAREQKLKKILGELEIRKSSLSLMVAILTCQMQSEAEHKVDQLHELTQEILKQNTKLAARMAVFELQQAKTGYLDSVAADLLELPGAEASARGKEPATPERGEPGSAFPDFEISALLEKEVSACAARTFAFEDALISSRPYRRAGIHDGLDVFSISSSAGRTAAWSMLSSISLSEISHIAFLALPVYDTDIVNKEPYGFRRRRQGNSMFRRRKSRRSRKPSPSPMTGPVISPPTLISTTSLDVHSPDLIQLPLTSSDIRSMKWQLHSTLA